VNDLVVAAVEMAIGCPSFLMKTTQKTKTLVYDLVVHTDAAAAAAAVVEVMIDCPSFLRKKTTHRANPSTTKTRIWMMIVTVALVVPVVRIVLVVVRILVHILVHIRFHILVRIPVRIAIVIAVVT